MFPRGLFEQFVCLYTYMHIPFGAVHMIFHVAAKKFCSCVQEKIFLGEMRLGLPELNSPQHHAILMVEAGEQFVQDLGSRNCSYRQQVSLFLNI